MLTSGRTGMFQGLWAYILISEESDCAQLAALGMLHFTTPGPRGSSLQAGWGLPRTYHLEKHRP